MISREEIRNATEALENVRAHMATPEIRRILKEIDAEYDRRRNEFREMEREAERIALQRRQLMWEFEAIRPVPLVPFLAVHPSAFVPVFPPPRLCETAVRLDPNRRSIVWPEVKRRIGF